MEDRHDRIELGAGNKALLREAYARFAAEAQRVAVVVCNQLDADPKEYDLTPDLSALVRKAPTEGK